VVAWVGQGLVFRFEGLTGEVTIANRIKIAWYEMSQ